MKRATSFMQPGMAATAAQNYATRRGTDGIVEVPTAREVEIARRSGGVVIGRCQLSAIYLDGPFEFERTIRFCSCFVVGVTAFEGLIPVKEIVPRIVDMTGEVLIPEFRANQVRAVETHFRGDSDYMLNAELIFVTTHSNEVTKMALTGFRSGDLSPLAFAA